MISLIFVISLILMIVFIIGYAKTSGDGWMVGIIVFCIITIISFLSVVDLLIDYSNIYSINSKIEVYEAENIRIKEELGWLDNNIAYEEYDTNKKFKDSQLTLYYFNCAQIEDLKLQKAELAETKWLLFFGR